MGAEARPCRVWGKKPSTARGVGRGPARRRGRSRSPPLPSPDQERVGPLLKSAQSRATHGVQKNIDFQRAERRARLLAPGEDCSHKRPASRTWLHADQKGRRRVEESDEARALSRNVEILSRDPCRTAVLRLLARPSAPSGIYGRREGRRLGARSSHQRPALAIGGPSGRRIRTQHAALLVQLQAPDDKQFNMQTPRTNRPVRQAAR